MRYKSRIRFLHTAKSNSCLRYFSVVNGGYSSVKNQTQACKIEVDEIVEKLHKQDSNLLISSLFNRLFVLNTYYSLKLCGGFSLTLEEVEQLQLENRTSKRRSFTEYLLAANHIKILNYCSEFQRKIQKELLKSPDEKNLFGSDSGLYNIIANFELLFSEGVTLRMNMQTGEYDAIAEYYFLGHQDSYAQVVKSRELLEQTMHKGAEDPFMNAALIHNEFAKGYQFDKEFGLLFCRLYMNFALMLAGYVPAIIDEYDKEEYFQLVGNLTTVDPEPLALFLARILQKTYQNHVFPHFTVGASSIRND